MKLAKPLLIIIAGLLVSLPGLLQAQDEVNPGSISISGGPPTSPQLTGTTNWISYSATLGDPSSDDCEDLTPTNTIVTWSATYGSWVWSTNNPAYWTNVFTSAGWYTNVTTCTVTWQGLDCEDNGYSVSTNASVTDVIQVVDHVNFALIAKDATATSDREGTTLDMVLNAPQRSANINTVVASGSFQNGDPIWSGTGVTGSSGSTTASWAGTQNTTVSASTLSGDSAQAMINIHATSVTNETVDFNGTVGGTKAFLQNWLLGFGLTGTIVSSGSLNSHQELDDIYGCPSVGYSRTLNGSPSLAVTVGGGPTINFSVLSIPLSLTYNSSGSVSATFTIANVSHDFTKPPGQRWAGSASYSASGTVSLSSTQTWTVNTLGVQSISLSNSANLDVDGTSSFDNTSGNFTLSLGFKQLSVTITPTITYTDGSVDDLPITIGLPGGASLPITINLHDIIGNHSGNDPCSS